MCIKNSSGTFLTSGETLEAMAHQIDSDISVKIQEKKRWRAFKECIWKFLQ